MGNSAEDNITEGKFQIDDNILRGILKDTEPLYKAVVERAEESLKWRLAYSARDLLKGIKNRQWKIKKEEENKEYKPQELVEEKVEVPEKEESLNKIVFGDVSKIDEKNFNSILDAFVRMNNMSLDQINGKSLNDLFILFDDLVEIGRTTKELTDISLGKNIIDLESEESPLEDQINALNSVMGAGNVRYEQRQEEILEEAYAGVDNSELYRTTEEIDAEPYVVGGTQQDSEYLKKAEYQDHAQDTL